jgi:hypothetical protein
MAPLDARREALEDVYGFVCVCPRCKEEERLVSWVFSGLVGSCCNRSGSCKQIHVMGGEVQANVLTVVCNALC